jgi:hypothetical protein
MIVVVSTGRNAPTKQKCVDSVRKQGRFAGHTYVEAGEQYPPCTVSENVYAAAASCDPADVIAWLDGDDWFAHDGVIAHLETLYADPDVWLTYGSYVHTDGRMGCAAPYETADYRVEPWKASHLKTFRAALFRHLTPDDLRGPDGRWIRNAHDQAIMLPLLEMAGPKHIRFVPDILVIYNYANSLEHNGSHDDAREEIAIARWLRAKTPKERLATL